MMEMLQPLRAESLKEVFVARFEELILSGQVSIGQKLPSERELALKLGVSRPVVHEGLLDLAVKGLVTIRPRQGAVVNDYRQEGSLALLNSLVGYHQGGLEPGLLLSLLEMRSLFEVETARLAARRRTPEHLAELKNIVRREEEAARSGNTPMAELDFSLHHLVAMASGNLLYPLLLNSFKDVYINLAGQFFTDPAVTPMVLDFHRSLVKAVEAGEPRRAARIMERMLAHGRDRLLAKAGLEERRES
ncbi:MAG: FadR/GntR family transcriptional regulator [Thermodesulfobacteriota bacterium]